MSHRLAYKITCSVLAAFVVTLVPALAGAQEAIAEAVPTLDNREDAQPTSDELGDESIAQSQPSVRPLTVSATLTDRSIITGTLLDSNSVSIKTAFGEASLPLSEVAGIRFPAADDTSTTVVMLNGDSITGATDLKFIEVETTWGSAKINGQSIGNMLFVPGLAWKATEALGGRRWMLAEKTAAENQTQQQVQNAVQPASSSRQVQPNSGVRTLPNMGRSTQQLPTPAPQIIYGR